MFIKIFLISFTTIIGVHGFVLPVQKCTLSDSDCLKAEFQKAVPIFMSGIKEYGIDVMDPMAVEFIEFDLAGLQFTLKNSTLTGLKTAFIENVVWDSRRQQFTVTYHFVSGKVIGRYTAAGKLFVLPVSGEGEMTFYVAGLQITLTFPYDIVKRADGKDYVELKNLELEHEAKENPRIGLTNLFDGNKELSDRMHAFVQEHWKPITAVFGRPLAIGAMTIVQKNMQKFFKNVPLSDIAEY